MIHAAATTGISITVASATTCFAVGCTVGAIESLGVRVESVRPGRVRCYLPRAHRAAFQATKGELAAMCPAGVHMTLLLERA